MKIDLDTLRKAVNQKLINEQLAIGFHKPIDIHQGSHTSFNDMDHHHDDEDFMSNMGMDDYGDDYGDRKSTRLNSSHIPLSRMPSSA